MAKSNEIEIVVKGKDDSEVTITKTTKRAQEAAEAIRRSGETAADGFRRTRQGADEASGGLDKFGEAADTTDTRAMGFRDTMTGVQDTMLGVSDIAKGNLFNGFLTLGMGVGDLGSGVYNFLVPAMQSAKGAMAATAVTATETAATETAAAGERAAAQTAAANTTVTATSRAKAALASTAGFVAGPWGVAILGAAAVLGAFGMVHMQNKARVDNFTNSLDEQTGAITQNTRLKKAAELEEGHWLETAEAAGVSTQDLTEAVLGNEVAYKRVKAAIDEALSTDPGKYDQDRFRAAAMLNGELKRQRDALDDSREAVRRKRDATAEDTEAVDENTGAYRRNASELRKQIDPVFAFLDAQENATEAQQAYTSAVRKHGRHSAEAEKANRDLTRAQFDLMAAAEALAGNFNGRLTPAQRSTLKAAGATEAQLRDLERQLARTKRSAEAYAKTYRARIITIYETTGQRVAGITGAGGHSAMAHGGISGAAGGGPRSGLTWVGEEGPELVDLAPGSTVIPAGTSANMMAAGGGGPVQLVLKIERTGDRLIDVLMEMLARQIRVEGGNVQQVLGS